MKNDISKIILVALDEAKKAGLRGEVPVGAVVFKDHQIIAKAGNMVEESNDASAHAEIIVMRQACELLSLTRLNNYSLYVTLEPCLMCTHAITLFRIKKLFFGAYDTSYLKDSNKLSTDGLYDRGELSIESYGGFGLRHSENIIRKFFKKIKTGN